VLLGGAAMAFLYKIWRILQSDRKVDNLDNAERSFREEMRDEIKTLKEDKRKCEDEKEKLYNQVHTFQKNIAEIQVAFKLCQISHPSTCPLLLNHHSGRNSDESN
jgi:hypothetical protein